jgi:hypothetical protein
MAFIAAVAWLWERLKGTPITMLDGLFYTLRGALWLFMKGVFVTVSGFVATISFSEVVFQWAAAYAALSPQASYVMVAIGFPEFVTMIAGAYVVRLGLNMIPSWVSRL